LDRPSARYGLQSFLVSGRQPGEWLGPTSVATVLERLVNHGRAQSSVVREETSTRNTGASTLSSSTNKDPAVNIHQRSSRTTPVLVVAENKMSKNSSPKNYNGHEEEGGTSSDLFTASSATSASSTGRMAMSRSYEQTAGSFQVYIDYDGCIYLDEIARLSGKQASSPGTGRIRNSTEGGKHTQQTLVSVDEKYLDQGSKEEDASPGRPRSVLGTRWPRSVLLLLPFQKGVGEYMDVGAQKEVAQFLQNPYSLGLLSGRPRKAHYFVGCLEQHLLVHLDPHTVQEAALNLRQPTRTFSDSGGSRNPSEPVRRKMLLTP
ncbi:unnamed protein product, partial [Amoebophrya sp. A25]